MHASKHLKVHRIYHNILLVFYAMCYDSAFKNGCGYKYNVYGNKKNLRIGQSEQPGTLRVSDVISIMNRTSPLKTNPHDSSFELPSYYRTFVYFYVHNFRLFLCTEKCTVLRCHDHYLNTDRRRRVFLIPVKAQKS